MRIWLIGGDRIGTTALQQLQKNPELELVVSDSTERPYAVQEGVISQVDLVENVSPVNINELAHRIRPDLILLSPGGQESGFGSMEGGRTLADALNYEITSRCEHPCIILSLSNQR